jgi:hypothetical protein
MPNLDLTHEEHTALLRLVKRALDTHHFSVKAILAKLGTAAGPGADPASA